MSRNPSIKGSVVASHAEVLKKYLDRAQVEESVLASRFESGDLDVLLDRIDLAAWYDIGTYRRMMEFLRDHDGGGDPQYLIDAGRRTAENLIRAGIHQQFEYLRRTQHSKYDDPRERFLAFGRDLRLLATITGSILNFCETRVVEDPEHANRWVIQNREAEAYPEVLCWTTLGFTNRMAEEHGAPDLWYWERPSPDVMQMRMKREI